MSYSPTLKVDKRMKVCRLVEGCYTLFYFSLQSRMIATASSMVFASALTSSLKERLRSHRAFLWVKYYDFQGVGPIKGYGLQVVPSYQKKLFAELRHVEVLNFNMFHYCGFRSVVTKYSPSPLIAKISLYFLPVKIYNNKVNKRQFSVRRSLL